MASPTTTKLLAAANKEIASTAAAAAAAAAASTTKTESADRKSEFEHDVSEFLVGEDALRCLKRCEEYGCTSEFVLR